MDRNAFEGQLKRDGYNDISENEMVADESRAEHAHHFDVSTLVLAGAITLTCAGAKRTYGAGECFTMKAGTMHAEDVGPAGVRYLVGRRH
jgi:quercetin dioxygenase-like cupin family protein